MALIVFVTALTLAVVRATGSFNADELASVFYDVDILGEPKLTTEMTASPTSMLLLSKHGQRYECRLPANAHTLAAGGASDGADDAPKSQIKSEEEIAKLKAGLVGIPKLLDEMAAANCLRLSKGWWEYEFCFRKQIRQFHVNDQTGTIENESILGQFVADFDWSSFDVNSLSDDSGSEGKKSAGVRSHSQSYTDGSMCDLTGAPRRAEVRFHCDPTPLAGDTLVDVEEPTSCVYRLTVRTGRLCANPLLRRAAEAQMPSRRKPPESIQCRPLLEPASMQRYRKAQAAKRLADLKAEELKKLRRIQRLNPLRRLARIRHVVAGRLGGPLRRRKFAQLALRRRQRVKAAAEKAKSVLGTEASLKKLTKKLKAKFLATGTGKQAASDEGDASATAASIKELLSSLPNGIRQRLTSRRGMETLRSGIGAQFEQIMQEARREVGGGVNPEMALPQDGGGGDRELVSKMSVMLDKILSQVDDAGRKLDKETKRFELEHQRLKAELERAVKSAGESGKRRRAAKSTTSAAAHESRDGAEQRQATSDGSSTEPGGKLSTKKLKEDALKFQPQKKLPGRKSKVKTATADADAEAEAGSPSSRDVEKLRGRLEAGIREKMERRGLETNGLTLHLMTLSGSQSGEEDGDGKEKSFVGIIILKNDRQQQEQERMQRLEDNYNFRVDNDPVL